MGTAVVQLRLDDGGHVQLSAAARAVTPNPLRSSSTRLAGEPRVLERPPGAIGEPGAVKGRAAVAVDARAAAKGTLRDAEDGRGRAESRQVDPPSRGAARGAAGGAAGVAAVMTRLMLTIEVRSP